MKEVGSYEAKTHLPALLREVAQGARISITKNGRPIAMLVPVDDKAQPVDRVISQIKSLRKGVTLGDVDLKTLIAEGRR